MPNPVTIGVPGRTFEMTGAVGANVAVKASAGTVNAKRGHLVVNIGGNWIAYPVATNPLTQEVASATYDAVGVLLDEEAALTTTPSNHRVLYAGKVWEQFIRDAGIASSVVSMNSLRIAKGHIVFVDEEA